MEHRVVETLLTGPQGYASREVARFLWQLDEQSRRLTQDTRGLTPADLEWQVAPGTNSIGMLLAHIAYAETHLGQVGLLDEPAGHSRDVIGITEDDEGMPLAPGAPPSPALAGRTLEDYDDMLRRAREHTKAAARKLTDADLDQLVRRPPRAADGVIRVWNKAWVFYHMLEHMAGHHYQINLLRHLRRQQG